MALITQKTRLLIGAISVISGQSKPSIRKNAASLFLLAWLRCLGKLGVHHRPGGGR
jgi:hypothetical protein